MTSHNCPNHDDLIAFASAKVPDESADVVLTHLETCPDCRSSVESHWSNEDDLLQPLRQAASLESMVDEPEFQSALSQIEHFPLEGRQDGSGEVESHHETSRDAEQFTPRQLGEYRLVEELGRGGMGTVYKAVHSSALSVVY